MDPFDFNDENEPPSRALQLRHVPGLADREKRRLDCEKRRRDNIENTIGNVCQEAFKEGVEDFGTLLLQHQHWDHTYSTEVPVNLVSPEDDLARVANRKHALRMQAIEKKMQNRREYLSSIAVNLEAAPSHQTTDTASIPNKCKVGRPRSTGEHVSRFAKYRRVCEVRQLSLNNGLSNEAFNRKLFSTAMAFCDGNGLQSRREYEGARRALNRHGPNQHSQLPYSYDRMKEYMAEEFPWDARPLCMESLIDDMKAAGGNAWDAQIEVPHFARPPLPYDDDTRGAYVPLEQMLVTIANHCVKQEKDNPGKVLSDYKKRDRTIEPFCFHYVVGADGTPFRMSGLTTYGLSIVNIAQGVRSRKHCFSMLVYSGKEDDPILYYYNCLLSRWIEVLENCIFRMEDETLATFRLFACIGDTKNLAWAKGQLSASAKFFSSFVDVEKSTTRLEIEIVEGRRPLGPQDIAGEADKVAGTVNSKRGKKTCGNGSVRTVAEVNAVDIPRNFYVWSYDEAVEVAEGVQNYKLKNPEARRDVITAIIGRRRSEGGFQSNQEFTPSIGRIIWNRVYPDPLHAAINAWRQWMLAVLEAVAYLEDHKIQNVQKLKRWAASPKLKEDRNGRPLVKFINMLEMVDGQLHGKMASKYDKNKAVADFTLRGISCKKLSQNVTTICSFLLSMSESLVDAKRPEVVLEAFKWTVFTLAVIGLLLRSLCMAQSKINVDRDRNGIRSPAVGDEFWMKYKDTGKNLLKAFSLFLNEVNPCIFHISRVVPFFAHKLYQEHGTGIGILDMNSRESNHQVVKDYRVHSGTKKSVIWKNMLQNEYTEKLYLAQSSPASSRKSDYDKILYVPNVDPRYCQCGLSGSVSGHCKICNSDYFSKVFEMIDNNRLSDECKSVMDRFAALRKNNAARGVKSK